MTYIQAKGARDTMGTIVGIDLGTTKSVVAVWENGVPRIIPDDAGRAIMPSVVAIQPETRRLFAGYEATAAASDVPGTAITSIKRLMGRSLQEADIQHFLLKQRPLYHVGTLPGRQGTIAVGSNNADVRTPQEISAAILQHLKERAEKDLGYDITQAVITVPAYFLETQRLATQKAGELALLQVVRMVNEPTAACLAFSYNRLNETRKKIAVYDLGGGTFDISILETGGHRPLRVRATNGDTLLGGDNINQALVDWLLEHMESATREAWQRDFSAQVRLLATARAAKEALSEQETALIQVQGPASTPPFEFTLTREQLELLTRPFIQKTLAICTLALQDARLEAADIDEVLLIGGQTRMPAVRQAVGAYFGKTPNTSIPPEEAVARGAAVLAAMLAGKTTGLILADVVPLTLGVKTRGGIMHELIKRNTPIPTEISEDFSTTEDNQGSIDIDIYQGENPQVSQNTLLHSLRLSGIEIAPVGQPQIKITFKVDADGILHVSGQDMFTGQARQVTITTSTLESEEEIDRQHQEAEQQAGEYAATRLRLEQKLKIDDMSKKLKRLLNEQGPGWPKELLSEVQGLLEASEEEQLEKRLASLETALYQVQHQANKGAQA